eukprot:PhF_6_TR598/c0_g1_i1/m.687
MSTSAVRVCVRVKPSSESQSPLIINGLNSITHRVMENFGDRKFLVDRVYHSTEDTQSVLFHEIGSQVVSDIFDAVNVCVLAYGQAGTGKAYTMVGAETDGLVPRVFDELFATIAKPTYIPALMKISTTVTYSAFFIFNEKVYDASPVPAKGARRGSMSSTARPNLRKEELRIREHPSLGPYVEGLSETVVKSAAELKSLYLTGVQGRPSPKAHFLVCLRYEQLVEQPRELSGTDIIVPRSETTVALTRSRSSDRLPSNTKATERRSNTPLKKQKDEHEPLPVSLEPIVTPSTDKSNFSRRTATLSLCDLASVDRSNYEIKTRQPTAEERQMGGRLNQGLSCLTRIVGMLSEKTRKGILPYRDSVLTWILKDRLGGNCKTILLATISSEMVDAEATLSTLMFAERARSIKGHFQHNVQNENPVVAILRELTDLHAELHRNREAIRGLLKGIKKEELEHRGTSLTIDSDFFGGSCIPQNNNNNEQGKLIELTMMTPVELENMDRNIELRIQDNNKALKDLLQPIIKGTRRESNPAIILSSTMAQLGPQRCELLNQAIPEEMLLVRELSSEVLETEHPSSGQDKVINTDAPPVAVVIQPVSAIETPPQQKVVSTTPPRAPTSTGFSSTLVLTNKSKPTSADEGGRTETESEEKGDEIDKEIELLMGEFVQIEGESVSDYLQRREMVQQKIAHKKEEKMWKQLTTIGEMDKNLKPLKPLGAYPTRTTHRCSQSFTSLDTSYVETNSQTGEVVRQYRSIAKACLACEPGDKVIVYSGTYNESVTLSVRGVAMKADGYVIIKPTSGTNLCLTVTAQDCKIEGFNFECNGGDSAVLFRSGGTGEITKCVFTAFKCRTALRVYGVNTNPHVHHSKFNDCGGHGLTVVGGACGLYEHNTFKGCKDASVLIEGSCHPVFRENTVSKGYGAGILIESSAGGLYENNVLEENACSAILINENCNPTIRNNRIRLNKGGGIAFEKKARGLAEGNTLADNRDWEIKVKDGALAQIRNNTFTYGNRPDSAIFGVLVTDEARALLVMNVFRGYHSCIANQRNASAYSIGNVFHLETSKSCVVKGFCQFRYCVAHAQGECVEGIPKGVSGIVLNGKDPTNLPADALVVPHKFVES